MKIDISVMAAIIAILVVISLIVAFNVRLSYTMQSLKSIEQDCQDTCEAEGTDYHRHESTRYGSQCFCKEESGAIVTMW